MSELAIYQELKESSIPLECIFLDPNNPRFFGSDWQHIPDKRIAETNVQEEAMTRLVKQFGVENIRMSIETNGYLPIDRIIVREFRPSNYVVLEGNRRICAAKMIAEARGEAPRLANRR